MFNYNELKRLSVEYPNDWDFAKKIRDMIREVEDKKGKLTLSELDDLSMRSEDWLVEQYNRNRKVEDHVNSREDIPYIYERNPDTNEIFRRRSGDYESPRELINELPKKV
jgi:hypothetical protein